MTWFTSELDRGLVGRVEIGGAKPSPVSDQARHGSGDCGVVGDDLAGALVKGDLAGTGIDDMDDYGFRQLGRCAIGSFAGSSAQLGSF
jgi:hypothetical protein